jgi:hypothetical protein
MAVRNVTLTEAFAGPQITLYGNLVSDFPFNETQATAAGISSAIGPPRFARILAFQRPGVSCTRLPRPIIVTVFGDGEELTHPECGFSPGQVRKWEVSLGTRVLALDPSQGAVEDILASTAGHGAGHGRCECEGGSAAVRVPSTAAAAGACISVTVNNGQVCLNIPIYGSVCISVPSWVPNGTAAEACIDICSKFLPCGVKVTLTVAGVVVASQSWGCC